MFFLSLAIVEIVLSVNLASGVTHPLTQVVLTRASQTDPPFWLLSALISYGQLRQQLPHLPHDSGISGISSQVLQFKRII